MKRYITLALCALTVFGLGSCNKVHEEDVDSAIRTVTFQAQMGGDTRTGLALKFVPDWRETNLSDVHIYEIDGDERIEGEDIEMTIPGASEGNYEIALFKADFSNMTIIVNPPSSAPRTRASEEVFQYTAVVASQDAVKKFTVPATQYPATSTLIDPHADFIVGTSVQDFNESQAGKQVNLKFVRPVAVSRLSIMNVEDATIKQVKIYSSDKLTGSAAYGDVNFANGTVAFDNSGSNVLTLDYGTGVAMPAEGIFNAYFVSLTGTKRITKIEVVTNAQTLTKEFEGGKALTFKVPDFKSIAVNMAGTGSVEPGPGDPLPQNISFTKGGSAIETDSFDLYTGETYVSPTVAGAATGATLTFSSSDVAVATVSSTGVVTPQGVGETTISVVASAVEGYQAGQAEYVLTVTDSTPLDQTLVFEPTSLNVVLGQPVTAPTLSGAMTAVTYSSSNADVAEVNASTGALTIKAVGTATITATAAAGKVSGVDYKEATATYEVTVTEAPVTPHYYAKVTDTAEPVLNGKYIFVYEDGADTKVFKPVLNGTDRFATTNNTLDATVMGGSWIASSDAVDACMVVLERQNGTNKAFDIYVPGISTADTKYYFVPRNNTNTFVAMTGQGDYRPTFAVSAAGVFTLSRDNNYFYLVNGAFNMTSTNPGTTSKLALFKYFEGENPGPVAQTLSFEPTSVTGKVGATVAAPVLSGAKTTVTYSCDHPAVATVDAETGALTLLAAGTATVTASAAAENGYAAATATYEVTVVEAGSVARYTKVMSVGELEVGAKYLIVYEGTTTTDNTPKVFNPVLNSDGTQFAKATSSAVNVTLASGVIESSDVADYEFTLEAGYYLKADKAAKYLYPGTVSSGYSTSSVLLAESSASHALAITFNNGIAQILCNARYVVWSTNSHYFSSNADVSGSYSTGICLYKLDDGRQAQEISFSAADAEYDLGTSTWTKAVPTLTGTPQGDVTYSSSDETVATVSNAGVVTPLKKGTATITATAAGNATYKPASASYELNIVNSNLPTYVKADEVESGKAYLIVSNGNVLVNNNGTAAVEAVTVSGGQIKYDAPDAALWTATVSSGSITFANGSRTLGRNSSNISLSASASFSYDSENEYLTTKSSSTSTNTYYLYCTTSFRYSQNSAQNAALYVLDDGRQAQKISFSAADAEYDLGTSTWTKAVPTLSGVQTTVTYASSDATVATVANDGTVTPLKVGTTTITATAAENAQYKKGTATYVLSVVNSAVVEKTYNRVSSISAGTYLIMGRETNQTRIGTYVCVFPPIGDNKCDHIKVSDNQDLATLTTTSNEYGAYEVELIASGSNWLVKVKSSGQYMYYASGKISFTDDASVAAQQITSNGGYPACIQNSGNDQFYHSGSNEGFMYSNAKNANNLRFFKLSE